MFVSAVRRVISNYTADSIPRILLNVTLYSNPTDNALLSTHCDPNWTIYSTGLFDSDIEGEQYKFKRFVPGLKDELVELDDGTLIESGKLNKVLPDGTSRVSILAFDYPDDIETAIDSFPFDTLIAEQVIVNLEYGERLKLDRKLIDNGYYHVDSGIYIPSRDIRNKFTRTEPSPHKMTNGRDMINLHRNIR